MSSGQLIRFLKPFFPPLVSVLILTLVFSCFRVFEIFLHRAHLFSNPPLIFQNLSRAFLFDFLFFVLWNGIYFVFHLFAEYGRRDSSRIQRKILFCILNIPLLLLFFVDMQALSVSGHLMNSSLISAFKWEILLNAFILVRDYWFLILVFFAGAFPVLKWCPVKMRIKTLDGAAYKRLSFFYLGLFLSYSFMALLYMTNRVGTSFYQETFYNGAYFRIFVRTGTKNLFFTTERFREIISSLKEPVLKRERKPLNVILFVMESFSRSYLTKENTPFLHGLSEKGLFLENHYSLSFGTGSSISYILSGSHPVMFHKIGLAKSGGLKPPLHVFRSAGWRTFFFWGDSPGVLGFKNKMKDFGVDHYVTKENYLKDTDRRQDVGLWGDVYEKPFLKYTAQKLKKVEIPFVSLILTNEPHYPYDCPGQKDTFTKEEKAMKSGALQIHLLRNRKPLSVEEEKIRHCVRYVDKALEDFFQDIRRAPWFENTLFVWTGDHPNSMDRREERSTMFDRYNVPLLFYSPKEKLQKYQSGQVTSHADILPAVMDYIGLPLEDRFLFTTNFIFRSGQKKRVVYYSHALNLWFLREGDHLLEYDIRRNRSRLWRMGTPEESLKLNSIKTGGLSDEQSNKKSKPLQMPREIPVENKSLQKEYEQMIKAYIQYYNHGPYN